MSHPRVSRSLDGVERNQPVRARNRGRAEAPAVFDRHAEPLHERSRVLAEALLPRNQRIAVMRVLHGALLQIGGTADVVVRSNDETGSFTAQKLPDRLDLFRRGLLFGDQVIQAEDHQRVGVAEDALVQRQSLAGLIDPLKDCDRRSGDSPDHLLESHDGQMEQLQCSGDALQKHLFRILRPFRKQATLPGEPRSSSRSDCPSRSYPGWPPTDSSRSNRR